MLNGHLDELLITSYIDGELEPVRAREVREHLDVCDECRGLLSETEHVLRSYASAWRKSAPPPPKPWANLALHMNDLDAERFQTRPRPSTHTPSQRMWWLAAAAGVAFAFVTLRLSTEQTVSAAELLEKASVNDAPAHRLLVKTRSGRFIRSAQDLGAAELAAMFREANFDWEEPLQARAFATWRSGLKQREDEVRVFESATRFTGRHYRIRTSTPEGKLQQVSIVIRAADMRAVEERFEFRNQEWVEISEAPPEPRQSPMPLAQSPSPSGAEDQTSASASDEVRVLLALHKIGADLGEPIEVQRAQESVVVTVLGASARREKELRDAVGGLPRAVLRFEQPQPVRAPAAGGGTADEPPSGALQSRLLADFGSSANVEAFINRALEQSETVLARAHAIDQAAHRFSPQESLTEEDREALRSIASDHLRILREELKELKGVLEPLTGKIEIAPAERSATSANLLNAAQTLDTLLSGALASGRSLDDPEKSLRKITQALATAEGLAREFKP